MLKLLFKIFFFFSESNLIEILRNAAYVLFQLGTENSNIFDFEVKVQTEILYHCCQHC